MTPGRPQPDTRTALRKKFLGDVMARISKETENVRRERGGKKPEMESSEIFRVYSNDSKPVAEDNRLMKTLEKKRQAKENDGKIKNLMEYKMDGQEIVSRHVVLLGPTPEQHPLGAEPANITTFQELKRLDLAQQGFKSFEVKRQPKRGGPI